MPTRSKTKSRPAELVREYGPFPDAPEVHGVTYDGKHVWFASGEKLHALDPDRGELVRALDVAADAGTAFDGVHFFQLTGGRIQKLEAATGKILATIASPSETSSGLAWAEGTLWVGDYYARRIHELDPDTGALLRTIESDRFVTGISWVDGELWHGTWEGEESEVRRVDPESGEVLARLELAPGAGVTGLESDGGDLFYCGGGSSGKLRAIRRR